MYQRDEALSGQDLQAYIKVSHESKWIPSMREVECDIQLLHDYLFPKYWT